MKTKEEVLIKLGEQTKKVNVEFALIDDVDKLLDTANQKRRSLVSQGLKIAEQLNELQSDYTSAFMKAKDAENKAKDLGAEDLRKLFGARGDEAKDYQNQVGKASNTIKSILNAI